MAFRTTTSTTVLPHLICCFCFSWQEADNDLHRVYSEPAKLCVAAFEQMPKKAPLFHSECTYIKCRWSSKSPPVASNVLNQLWGCFCANSCLDTNTSLATAWPAAIYAHLSLTGAAGLSCWWNTVILFLITVCSMWDLPGLRTTNRGLCVCI